MPATARLVRVVAQADVALFAVRRPDEGMLLVQGRASGTELTGTLYEPGDEVPQFRGAPDVGAAYTWVCDEFYEVDSGGSAQAVDGREISVAFESPLPRGFDSREAALAAAREHIRTQFARIGIDDAEFDLVQQPEG